MTKSKLQIEESLEVLKSVPPRNPDKAARGRAHFLRQASEMRQAVSTGNFSRHSSWNPMKRKEKFAMNVLVSLLMAMALLAGGGATVVSAQDDLPNEPLYPVKTMTENAALWLNNNPQTDVDLLMEMTQARVREMIALNQMDEEIPAQVQARLEQHIHQALQIASGMDDEAMAGALLRIRAMLQTQEQLMQQENLHDGNPIMAQTRAMLQNRLQLVDQGLADPQGFRYTISNRIQSQQDDAADPGQNQQGEPGFHQNDQNGNGNIDPGTGNPDANGGQNNNGYSNPDPQKPNQQNGDGKGNDSGPGPNGDSGGKP